jgi:hypothetical protein
MVRRRIDENQARCQGRGIFGQGHGEQSREEDRVFARDIYRDWIL